jgi:hypothetical protein
MGLGMALTTVHHALTIHAALAPVFFFIISMNYFRKYNHLSPKNTAFAFVSFVIIIDFFVVALLINRSFDMFASVLGTWIPFLLIFGSTYAAGMIVNHNKT